MAQIALSFNQVQQQLANIEAIDYFFAKEMIMALTVGTDFSDDEIHVLFHVFTALSARLRAGHTCLPLNEIAELHWAVAYDELGQCSHQGYVFPTFVKHPT